MDPSLMVPRSFPMWPPPPPPSASDSMPPFLPPPNANLAPNRGWKRKNPNPSSSGGASYQPPAIGDLQVQNRAKARRWFNNPSASNPNNNRKPFFPNKAKANKPRAAAAAAPRNTTSFIMRAKRAGGIAPLVSPCPVTPAVLPTPVISPSRDEGLLSDVLAQQQWGVDGYGSMKGLIRLRPHRPNAADDEDEDNSSGDSDVEEHVEVERRLDNDLSRFEMVYPEPGGGYVFEDDDEYDRSQDVDVHVARLEEENLTLKERLFLMEQEVGDMRRRLEALEARFSGTHAAAVGSGENAAAVEARENVGNANAAYIDTVLKTDTEMGNANAATGAVEAALENGTERVDAASSSGNTVEKALKDETEMDDADNAVEEALENGTEKAEKSVEEDSADRAGAGSEENAEIGDAGSAQENGEESKQAEPLGPCADGRKIDSGMHN